MVAGIFAAHGIDWGGVQEQSAGYDTFENQKMRAIMKAHYGLPFCELPGPKGIALHDIFTAAPKENAAWMIKTGIEYFKTLQPLSPFNVFITRNPEDVAKSVVEKVPGATIESALKAANWRFDQMRILHQQHGGVWIDTDRVISGDLTQVREALEYCGILYDDATAKKVIKK